MLQAAGQGMQPAPVLQCKIDHRKRSGRKILLEPLACFDVTRGDQRGGQLVHAGIVADYQKRADLRFGLLNNLQDGLG